MVCRRTAYRLGVPLALAALTGLAGCSVDGVVILPGFEDPIADDDDDDDDDGTHENPNQNQAIPEDPDHPDPFGLACNVEPAGIDAALPCDAAPPSELIDPEVVWTWTGPEGEDSVIVTPLVANLDDDNDDDLIDPCDRPDLVVVAVDLPEVKSRPMPGGHIYILDSATGETKLRIDRAVDPTATPALADLDDDGVVEILAFERSEDLDHDVGAGLRRVVAFSTAGEGVWEVLWVSEAWSASDGGGGLAVADLDADGSPEILTPAHVLHADGSLAWEPSGVEAPPSDALPTTADLDLDDQLEVLYGRSIYEADGSFRAELELPGGDNSGVAAVANFDDDPYPEIYVQSVNHRFYDDDGSLLAACGGGGFRGLPVSVADIDEDGRAEILTQHGGHFTAKALTANSQGVLGCEPLWSIKIDLESVTSATAFDFLGDGSAEAIYADLGWVRIYDEKGLAIAEIERTARSVSTAYPVVVDADNDGAAEIIIADSEPELGDGEDAERPSIQLVQNHDDRFAPTRRIWNQHSYHATNIREDGRVPVVQADHWQAQATNRFRSNPAPTYTGEMCQSLAVE